MSQSKSPLKGAARESGGVDNEPRVPDIDVAFAACVFIVNVFIFLLFFGPEEQGYGDVVRGWNQFNRFFRIPEQGWGPSNQMELRIIMVSVSVVEVVLLRKLRLIERSTLVTYLSLPAAAYLVAKIRLEFLFFPLALISTGLPWRRELGVLAALIGLSVSLDEQNGLVIAAFRLVLLVFRAIKIRGVLFVAILIGVLLLSEQFSLLSRVFPPITPYSYTRDVANPDYSLLETGVVFVSSTILSINPFVDYPVAVPCSFAVVAIAVGSRFWSARAWGRAMGAPEGKAFLLTIATFTSFTHAFQNARYYFFYVPILTRIAGPAGTRRLMLLSLPVTLLMAIFYSDLGEAGRSVLENNVRRWGG